MQRLPSANPKSAGPKASAQKAKNTKQTLRRLWYYLSYYKGRLFLGFVLMMIATGLSLVGPFLIGQMIDSMAYGVDFNRVFLYAGLLSVFYIVSAILNYFLSIAMVKIAQSVVYKLRQDLFNKLTKVKVGFYDQNQTGDIISRMSYDIDTISTSLAADLMSFITAIITLVVSFIMMLLMSPILVLVFLVTIPLTFIVTRILSKIIRKKIRVRNQQLGQLNGYAEEMITAQKTIQSYVQEEAIFQKFKQHNEDAANKSYQSGYYSTIVGPTTNFINNFSTVLVGTVGGILMVFGMLALGPLAAFMLYSKRFSGPINQMSNLVADIQSALAAAERVFIVLDQEDEITPISEVLTTGIEDANISFDQVSFGYNQDKIILDNVSFNANKGQVIAIVGHTGAGKTTLVNLLMRFYNVNQGSINLDNANIDLYDAKYYRSQFTMVLQDTWLFKGTILENIKYGIPDATFEEVKQAAKKARIHHYIKGLAKGYDTLISDDGINVSKGQKQLLIIARAMLSKAKILILDEATSNVDTYTEIAVQEAMKELMTNKTCFVIAHRLSTIKNADLILLMEHGNIIEQGTHQSLMNKNGAYYRLFMSQFD